MAGYRFTIDPRGQPAPATGAYLLRIAAAPGCLPRSTRRRSTSGRWEFSLVELKRLGIDAPVF